MAGLEAATAQTSTRAHAGIGSTLAECRAQWGHEIKSEPAWCEGTAYSFVHNGLYLYVIISGDDRVGDISYFDNTGQAALVVSFDQEVRAAKELSIPFVTLWRENQNGKTYENRWNWPLGYWKQYGQEKGLHWVEFSADSTEGLVANSAKNKGWQIRSLKQFGEEQKVIKRLKKDYFDKLKTEVNVGALTQVK
jgi:hypothetical protein